MQKDIMESKTNLKILKTVSGSSLTSPSLPFISPISFPFLEIPICLRVFAADHYHFHQPAGCLPPHLPAPSLPFISVCFLSVDWISLPALFCTAQSLVLPASPARSFHFTTSHSILTLNQTSRSIKPASHLQ